MFKDIGVDPWQLELMTTTINDKIHKTKTKKEKLAYTDMNNAKDKKKHFFLYPSLHCV